MAVATMLVLTGCEVANPSPESIVPPEWGDDLRPTHVDIRYVPGGRTGCPGVLTPDDPCGGAQNLDIYPPVLGPLRGTFVWVHGGGFTGGDKYPLAYLGAIRRLTHLGWAVVSVNYRLTSATGGRFPAGAQDVIAALRWVRVNANSYGLDTRRLVVGGYSAGGALAGLAGTTGNSGHPFFTNVPPLSGWLSIAGILDFDTGDLSRWWGSVWLANPGQRAIASTTTWWDPLDPEGWLVHGDRDNVVEYANTTRLLARTNGSTRVMRDSVDVYRNGVSLPDVARGHGSVYGMNSTELVSWLNRLPTLEATANPIGSLESVSSPRPGAARITGWALDPDTRAPIDVHVFVDGRFRLAVTASTARPDVGTVYPLHGSNHGYDVEVTLRPGTRTVCAYAINVVMGTDNPLLGCRTVVVAPQPAPPPAPAPAAPIERQGISPQLPEPPPTPGAA